MIPFYAALNFRNHHIASTCNHRAMLLTQFNLCTLIWLSIHWPWKLKQWNFTNVIWLRWHLHKYYPLYGCLGQYSWIQMSLQTSQVHQCLQTGKAGFVIHQENGLTSSPSAMHFICSKKPNEKIIFCGMWLPTYHTLPLKNLSLAPSHS